MIEPETPVPDQLWSVETSGATCPSESVPAVDQHMPVRLHRVTEGAWSKETGSASDATAPSDSEPANQMSLHCTAKFAWLEDRGPELFWKALF